MTTSRNDMPPEELREYGRAVADWVAGFIASVEERPVLARVRPGEVKDALPASPPVSGESMDAILAGAVRTHIADSTIADDASMPAIRQPASANSARLPPASKRSGKTG